MKHYGENNVELNLTSACLPILHQSIAGRARAYGIAAVKLSACPLATSVILRTSRTAFDDGRERPRVTLANGW